ncbi:MAG: hypothetical protein ICV73_21945 [Acetobacteraceae bacterium]|nr:hypothetical protein [Acetobacteraceae bacterium]
MDDSGVEARITALLTRRHGQGWGTEPCDRRSGFLHGFGSVGDALLHSALFVPELIEVEGCVFLKDVGWKGVGWDEVGAGVRAARAEAPEKLKWYVDSFNWVELPYLFNDREGSNEEADALAEVLAQAWRARLQGLFPDRRFAVRVTGTEETGHTRGLGF